MAELARKVIHVMVDYIQYFDLDVLFGADFLKFNTRHHSDWDIVHGFEISVTTLLWMMNIETCCKWSPRINMHYSFLCTDLQTTWLIV